MSGYISPTGYNVAFVFDEGAYSRPLGYNVVFDFSSNIDFSFDAWTGETLQIDDFPLDLGTANAWTGETFELEISPWNIDFSDGSTATVDIVVSNIFLSGDAHAGAEMVVDLQRNHNFSISAYDGAEIITGNWLTTRPAQDFSHTYGEGSTLSFVIETTTTFDASAYTGETLDVSLTTAPAQNFVFDFYEGDTGVLVGLQTSSIFSPEFYDGSEAKIDLETTPGVHLEALGYSGETLELDIVRFPQFSFGMWEGATQEVSIEFHPASYFDPIFLAGETAFLDLSTETTFSVDTYEGSNLSVNLIAVPPPSLELDFLEGSEGKLGLSTTILIPVSHYSGETASIDLTISPQPEITLQFWTGESCQLSTISTSANLGTINLFHGETLEKISLDIEPPIIFEEGSEAFVELSTETTIQGVAFEGAESTIDLVIRPSEGLGIFRGYEGSTFEQSTIWTLRGVDIRVVFRHGIDFLVNIDSSTDFDLTTDACCGERDNSGAWIDIGLAPEPTEHYHGDKIKFEVELSVRPRFQFDFYDGTECTLKDYSDYLSGAAGEGSSVEFSFEADQNIRLCKGNFIPNADNVDVELVYTYDENCGIVVGYAGETLDLNFLETTVGMESVNFHGETIRIDIQAPELWEFNAYHGSSFSVTFLDLPMKAMGTGESASIAFFEPPYDGYSGETMTIGNLVTEYDVKFVETGCLDNEYVPQTEHGDPDWSKYNPVPVEVDLFFHEMKAICY